MGHATARRSSSRDSEIDQPVVTSSFVIAALLNQISFFAAYVPVALAVSVPMESLL